MEAGGGDREGEGTEAVVEETVEDADSVDEYKIGHIEMQGLTRSVGSRGGSGRGGRSCGDREGRPGGGGNCRR